MEMTPEQRLTDIVENILKPMPDLFLVLVKIKGNPGNQRVMILIDGDPSFTIEQCAKVSRALGHYLEENDVIGGKYTLEVSSPGVDYPLSLPRQYHKNVGREVKVENLEGETIQGILINSDEKGIEVSEKKTGVDKALKFEEIRKTNIIVSFN